MTSWLECCEKILWHNNFVEWQKHGEGPVSKHVPPDLAFAHVTVMMKHPSAKAVPFKMLVHNYHAPFFKDALCWFMACMQ